jgi:hypothetical protein
VQKREFARQEEAKKLADQALIQGTVQSISDEVEALWERYKWEIGPHLAFRGVAMGPLPLPGLIKQN